MAFIEDLNDLLIIGDSFCFERSSKTDWPAILARMLLGNEPTFSPPGEGFIGASWWSTRKRLMSELEIRTPVVLILCHSDAGRLPSPHDYCLNNASAFSDFIPEVPREVHLAAREYYEHLYDFHYSVWAQQAWFKELDEILISHEIPYVIHLHSFPNEHVFQHGVTVVDSLWSQCDDVPTPRNDTSNHFLHENSVKLAEFMVNTLQTYTSPRAVNFSVKE